MADHYWLAENQLAESPQNQSLHPTAIKYDRCAHTYMSAICIAASVIFWINQ